MKTQNLTIKTVVLLGLIVSQLSTVSCSGQEKPDKNTIAKTEKPDECYKVNKEYDSKGNLIRYDSSYTYSSGLSTINDSLIDFFSKQFRSPLHSFDSDQENLYMQDTTFQIRPFENDLFFKHFQQQNHMFEQMEKEMQRMQQMMRPQLRLQPQQRVQRSEKDSTTL